MKKIPNLDTVLISYVACKALPMTYKKTASKTLLAFSSSQVLAGWVSMLRQSCHGQSFSSRCKDGSQCHIGIGRGLPLITWVISYRTKNSSFKLLSNLLALYCVSTVGACSCDADYKHACPLRVSCPSSGVSHAILLRGWTVAFLLSLQQIVYHMALLGILQKETLSYNRYHYQMLPVQIMRRRYLFRL